MRTAIVIPIYNRPDYLRQCLASLDKMTRQPELYVLVNDASTDGTVKELCEAFCAGKEAVYMVMPRNSGVRTALQTGISMAISKGCGMIVNLDSDALVSCDMLSVLLSLKEKYPNHIISGFNSNNSRNPALKQYKGHCTKRHINGINMCFSADEYTRILRPALQRPGNWDQNVSTGSFSEFIISTPSVVQHIGLKSSMGHDRYGAPDIATDFEIISLPDVTLFGIDAHNPKGIMRAAEICQRDIQFGAVNIIAKRLFPGATLQEGRTNYSRFMIKELHKHFNTSHVLTIHTDGYVVNAKAWDNVWLQYDYIGATWGYKDNMNVGNGGFSLRSKKLCEVLAKDSSIDDYHPEDDKICRKYRPYLEKQYGIKFAPEEVANIFSIEAYGAKAFPNGNRYSGQFGFHSVHVDFTGSNIPKEILL
jgi:glycosyltransferase involved in cell wall biosynthesis